MKTTNMNNTNITTVQKAHKLALHYINNAMFIDSLIMNTILRYIGFTICQEDLNKLISLPKIHFEDINLDTINSKKFIDNVGKTNTKNKISGVYIFTDKSDNSKYVGSSSQLSRRLSGYIKNTHKLTGKFLPLLYSKGIKNFSLDIIIVENGMQFILEQYFLLHKEYNLNTLKVVNSIYGTKNKPLYLYTKDFKSLIYYSEIQEDFVYKLGIHYNTFSKYLKSGKLYLNKYIFTSKPVDQAFISNMTVQEIRNMLDKDKKKINNKAVLLTNIISKKILSFDSIKDCVTYLNTIKPANKTTLYRRIKSGKEYNGYICK